MADDPPALPLVPEVESADPLVESPPVLVPDPLVEPASDPPLVPEVLPPVESVLPPEASLVPEVLPPEVPEVAEAPPVSDPVLVPEPLVSDELEPEVPVVVDPLLDGDDWAPELVVDATSVVREVSWVARDVPFVDVDDEASRVVGVAAGASTVSLVDACDFPRSDDTSDESAVLVVVLVDVGRVGRVSPASGGPGVPFLPSQLSPRSIPIVCDIPSRAPIGPTAWPGMSRLSGTPLSSDMPNPTLLRIEPPGAVILFPLTE